ncbi:MAG: family N-acetyltransferase [Marmoricola sp.]|jgi:predicted GNAT superfamily acetyltransferase|nr:family N-acetyltransferase [Marmoricola sp.]
MILRPVSAEDHADVLALNERNVELLAPLDEDRLDYLLGIADTAAVIDVDGAFAGFVITFASGSSYDGENFGWFTARFADFSYLDRVVIHEDFRRRGLGSEVYDELESTSGRPLFALEVNLDPPNDASLAFHHARGFVEVGQRVSGGHLVSLFLKTLPTG